MSGSRSGTATTPNAKRSRPMVTITLSPEGLAMLDDCAKSLGLSRSASVEWIVRGYHAETTPKIARKRK